MSPSTHSVKTGDPWPFYDDLLYKATAGFVLLLKALFKDQPAGQYKWAKDKTDSEIIITDQHPINLEVQEKRPAIVTIRGPASWAAASLGQTVQHAWITDKVVKQDLISTTISFACVSREGVEAQRLSWFIFTMLPLFKPIIHRSIPGVFDVGARMQVSPEVDAGALVQGSSSPEWKMVQVMCPLTLWHKSSIESADPLYLERIEMTMKGLSTDFMVVVD